MHPCCRFFFQETGVANHTSYWVYIHTQQATRSHGIGAIKWRFVLHKASVQSPIDHISTLHKTKKQNTESPSCSHVTGKMWRPWNWRRLWPPWHVVHDLCVIGALAVMVFVGVIVILIFLAIFEMTVMSWCFAFLDLLLCCVLLVTLFFIFVPV